MDMIYLSVQVGGAPSSGCRDNPIGHADQLLYGFPVPGPQSRTLDSGFCGDNLFSSDLFLCHTGFPLPFEEF